MARATSSFPVPVSPVIKTVESLGATLKTSESTACKAREVPTISSEHRGFVDFFTESKVFPLQSFLSSFAVFYIREGNIPARDLS
jgi:hypothetical protein